VTKHYFDSGAPIRDIAAEPARVGRLWYGKPDAVSNAIGYAKFCSRHVTP
jgi:hypothetical protein